MSLFVLLQEVGLCITAMLMTVLYGLDVLNKDDYEKIMKGKTSKTSYNVQTKINKEESIKSQTTKKSLNTISALI